MGVLIKEWGDPPQMNTGAPEPEIHYGRSVHCAYLTRDDSIALVRFDNVLLCKIGYPNDEALPAHSLYKHGLSLYAFQVVDNSPLIHELDKANEVHMHHVPGTYINRFRHWVITFHDETMEVIAVSATVVNCQATTQREAIMNAIRI